MKFSGIQKILRRIFQGMKGSQKYIPERYWKKRHRKYGFNFRGVGNCTLSAEENELVYQQAKSIFLSLCHDQKINFVKSKILDIGCGTGYYAGIVKEEGGKDYLGIDITDQLFPDLRKKFPEYSFQKVDISKVKLNKHFDLIIMIDVTQHIDNSKTFFLAMKNIASLLSLNGVFIVTSWLSKEFKRRTYYEVERPIGEYRKAFPGFVFSEPILFRDKYIMAIRKS